MKNLLILLCGIIFIYFPNVQAQRIEAFRIEQWNNPLGYYKSINDEGFRILSDERCPQETIKTTIFGKEYLVRLNYKKQYSANDEAPSSDIIRTLLYSSNITLEGIEFIDPANLKDIKKLNEMIEPELFSKFSSEGLSDWRPLLFLANSSKFIFIRKSFDEKHNDMVYILNLRSGEFIPYSFSPYDAFYITLKFGHPILVVFDGEKQARIVDLETKQEVIKNQLIGKYKNVYHYLKAFPSKGSLSSDLIYVDFPNTERYGGTEETTQFEIGIVTDKSFNKLGIVKRSTENEILFVDKEKFRKSLEKAINSSLEFKQGLGGVRFNGDLLLITDMYGSIYVYNIAKNGLLERKYGSLQIKNNQLSPDDISYLSQFGTNPFTNLPFK